MNGEYNYSYIILATIPNLVILLDFITIEFKGVMMPTLSNKMGYSIWNSYTPCERC